MSEIIKRYIELAHVYRRYIENGDEPSDVSAVVQEMNELYSSFTPEQIEDVQRRWFGAYNE